MRVHSLRGCRAALPRRKVAIAVTLAGAALLVCLAVVLGGCTVTTGPTQVVTVDEPLGAASLTDVKLSMGAGSLSIAPGAAGFASGSIRYNVESWRPEVVRTDDSLSIKQGSQKGVSGLGADLVNDWDLVFGKAPMRLSVSAGAYKGSYDLSGLTLQELTITDGAAKTDVRFDSPNPGQMSRFSYQTGASTVTMTGLANANFKSMTLKSGAGSYSLDFSGQLRTDASVSIETGAGTLRIAVPQSTPARITIAGTLNDVSAQGVWTVSDSTYSTAAAGAASQGRMLSITVKMNVGSVTLEAQ